VAFSPQASATCRRNLVPTFADRGVSSGQRGGSPATVNLSFLDRSRYFSFKQRLIYPHEADWTPFQTHCYTENLVAPGIEPRELWVSSSGTLTTGPQRGSTNIIYV
jgi:hypothetical protein